MARRRHARHYNYAAPRLNRPGGGLSRAPRLTLKVSTSGTGAPERAADYTMLLFAMGDEKPAAFEAFRNTSSAPPTATLTCSTRMCGTRGVSSAHQQGQPYSSLKKKNMAAGDLWLRRQSQRPSPACRGRRGCGLRQCPPEVKFCCHHHHRAELHRLGGPFLLRRTSGGRG